MALVGTNSLEVKKGSFFWEIWSESPVFKIKAFVPAKLQKWKPTKYIQQQFDSGGVEITSKSVDGRYWVQIGNGWYPADEVKDEINP